MKGKIQKYKNDFESLIGDFQSKIVPEDAKNFEPYLKFAQVLDSIEKRPFYLLNLHTLDFLYISTNYLLMLGYEKDTKLDFDFFFQAAHPDDFDINNDAPLAYQKFLGSIPKEEKADYKLVTDFRTKMPNGKYIRLIEHLINLLYDSKGNPILVFAMCDLSRNQNITGASGAYICHIPSGKKVMKMGNKEAVIDNNSITKREEKILRLVARGYSSKMIADKLNISIHTVSNHRNNIARKTSSSNTFEAIKYIFGL